ncbi:MAG: lamin tail domain-containing protein, partial [Candidatus Falkowbacteria bacterium]
MRKTTLVFILCGLLMCFGQVTSAAENKYSVELSGDLIDTINNLEQRLAALENKVAALENGCSASAADKAAISPIDQSASVPPADGTSEDKLVVAETPAVVEPTPAVVDAPAAVSQDSETMAGKPVTVEPAPAAVSQDSETMAGKPVISSGAVLINEFVSDPATGDKEWVEIYNNSASVIDLTGWTIEEGSGLKTKLSGGLGFGAYMVFDRASLN